MKARHGVVLAVVAACRFASGAEPYGLNAMLQLDRLPYLSSGVSAGQQSSYDRTGGNGDAGNFLYTNAGGEHVMLDLKGPGSAYCVWTTGFGGGDHLKAYIDGETQPRLDLTIANLFAGTNTPFLTPLAGNNAVSSGGFYSYVPLPFASSITITTTGSAYYHVGYHTFMPNAVVSSWSPTADVSAAQAVWQAVGADPKPASAASTVADSFDLGAGQSHTMLDIDGPGEVVSIRLRIPALGDIGGHSYEYHRTVTDNGRAFKGYSQFTVAIDPANQGVRLTRRLDYGIADQVGSVSVDGAAVGTWSTMGSDGSSHWRDSSFTIPSSFTSGKSSIVVKVTFVSSAVDWNEFYYWVFSKGAAGAETCTDSLDIGTAASETAHSYTINTQTWNGTQTFVYPGPIGSDTFADTLNTVNLRIFWDNEAAASVDAPIGAFFAMGHFGSYPTKSLMVGADTNSFLYCFFPMPFARHARVQLVSTAGAALPGIVSQISHASFTDPFDHVGYFKTSYRHASHSAGDGADVVFLDTAGCGKFLGVVASLRGPTSRGYLEGDERFYVDNNRSPAFHGTGTEDFFNAGWYFQNGPFSLPMQGNTAHVTDTSDYTAAYRFLLHDAVPFRTHMRASIEHGDRDGVQEEAWTLAYYYLNAKPSAVQTDSLDVGKVADESAHTFAVDSLTWSGSLTGTFEGERDNVSITDDGKANRGSCSFAVTIVPQNNGVILRRMFDQNDSLQQAGVKVDGVSAGTWYRAGRNTTHRWREDEFMLPSTLTAGKSRITIALTHAAGTPDWNAYTYVAFSLTDTAGATGVSPRTQRAAALGGSAAGSRYTLSIFAMDGRLVSRLRVGDAELRAGLSKSVRSCVSAGAYVYRLRQDSRPTPDKVGTLVTP